MARPRIYKASDMVKSLQEYIDTHDDPMIEEYLLTQPFVADTFYRYVKEDKLLSETTKKLHRKQLVRTVRKAEAGEINATFAIFKLKQKTYGWTDKQVVEQTSEINMNAKVNFDNLSTDEIRELLKNED